MCAVSIWLTFQNGYKNKEPEFFYESPAFNIPYFQRTVNMMDLQPKRSWLCSKPEVTDNMAVRSRRAVLLLSSRRLYITDCKHPVLFPLAILKLVLYSLSEGSYPDTSNGLNKSSARASNLEISLFISKAVSPFLLVVFFLHRPVLASHFSSEML